MFLLKTTKLRLQNNILVKYLLFANNISEGMRFVMKKAIEKYYL